MLSQTRKPSRAKSEELWKKAVRLIPSGTQTFSKGPGQYVNGVAPKYLQRGKGSRVWDVDGNEFIDYGMGLGPIILGYAYPRVDAAIAEQLKNGISFSLMHPLEVELSTLIHELVPNAEMVRFGKNGSDATAGAVRLARAFTKRDLVACCGYHGWQDWHIGSTTRRAGVPAATQALTKTFSYNDVDSLKTLFERHPGQIAAVILEPVNFVEPKDSFLEKVQELSRKNGALLIFDEVITGFRWALGGAQEYFGVTPDLATFGKALANGMPLSAITGRAEVMRLFDEVFFSFTAGGETLSLAAGLATLRELREKRALEHIWKIGTALRDGAQDMVAKAGLSESIKLIGYGCWPEFVFPSAQVQTLFAQEIIKRGILTRPGMFVCYSHTEEDVSRTLAAFGEALQIVADAVRAGDVEKRLEGDLIEPVIRASS